MVDYVSSLTQLLLLLLLLHSDLRKYNT